MSAEVEASRWFAWCPDCYIDGGNFDDETEAEAWAERHDAESHGGAR